MMLMAPFFRKLLCNHLIILVDIEHCNFLVQSSGLKKIATSRLISDGYACFGWQLCTDNVMQRQIHKKRYRLVVQDDTLWLPLYVKR